MDELVWIAFVVIGIFAVPIILAIVALNKAERVSRELFKLRGEFNQLRASMVDPSATEAPTGIVIPLPEKDPEPVEAADNDFAVATTLGASNGNDSGKAAAEPVVKAARSSLEENLAGTWFIWIGAVAIGLAGLVPGQVHVRCGPAGPGHAESCSVLCVEPAWQAPVNG